MSLDSFQVSRRTLLRGAGVGMATIGAGALLAACSPPSPNGGASVASDELLIATFSPPTDQAMKDAQKYLGDPIGMTLKYQALNGDTFASQLAAAQQAGRTPDLILQTAQYVPTMLAAGIHLEALDSYLSGTDTSDFYDGDLKAGSAGGKTYLLGSSLGCRAIAYRGDWAKAAGVGAIPASWNADEFGQFAKAITADKRAGFGWEAKTGDPRSPSNWMPLLWSTGANVVVGGPGKWETGFTVDQFETLMKFYSDMIYTYKATPTDVGGWGYEQTDGGFNKGVLASYSTGGFVRAIVYKTKAVNDALAAGPLPNLGTPSNFLEGYGAAIHGDSKKKDKAWEYIKNARGVEYQKQMVAVPGNANCSVRKSVNATLTDPVIKYFSSQLDIARTQDPIDIQPINTTVITPAMQKIALQHANPRTVAEEAMSAMKSALEQINNGK